MMREKRQEERKKEKRKKEKRKKEKKSSNNQYARTLIKGGNFHLLGVRSRDRHLNVVITIKVDAGITSTFEKQLFVQFLTALGNIGDGRRFAVVS